MATDDEILTRRLEQWVSTKGANLAPTDRLLNRWLDLVKVAMNGGTEDEREEAEGTFSRELEMFEAKLAAVGEQISVEERERKAYLVLQDELCTREENFKAAAEEKRKLLREAKRAQAQEEEYEKIRESCLEHPPRGETEASIREVDGELEDVTKEEESLELDISRRQKQYALLATVLADVVKDCGKSSFEGREAEELDRKRGGEEGQGQEEEEEEGAVAMEDEDL